MATDLPPTEAGTPPAGRRKGWIWAVFWLVVLAVCWFNRGTILAWWNEKPAAATTAGGGGRGRGGAGASVPVELATAVKGSVPVYLRGIGTVTAAYTVQVVPRVSGQIMKVDFEEGQLVHQGDVLVEIDKRPYQVALDQAKGQLEHDQALEKDAQLDLARYQALWQQQIIARQQLDTQQATVDEYQGAIATDQAQIANAQLNLGWCNVVAPITGRIGLRLIDPGNVIAPNSSASIAVITQVQPIAVLFSLPQEDLPQVFSLLSNGQHPVVTAFDSSNTKAIAQGRLLTINNQIDPTTGTYQLKAMFDNTDNALFPNQFVNMRLQAGVDDGLVIVPPAAIQRGPQGTYVFVADAAHGGRTVAMRTVDVKVTEGNQAGIDQGLDPGDQVVVDGTDKLDNGTRIVVGTPAMAEGGGATATSDPPVAAGGAAEPSGGHNGRGGRGGRHGRRGGGGSGRP